MVGKISDWVGKTSVIVRKTSDRVGKTSVIVRKTSDRVGKPQLPFIHTSLTVLLYIHAI
jgi:hypothetical protein